MKRFSSVFIITFLVIILSAGIHLIFLYAQSDVTLKEAVNLSNQNKYKEALDLLATIENDSKVQKDVYLVRGIIYQKQKKWNDAISAFKKIIQWDLKHVNAHHHLAMLYENQKNNTKAIEEWKKVLKYTNSDRMKKTAKKHIKVLKTK